MLFGTHIKKCVSGGETLIPDPLVFLMVLSKVEFLSPILFNVYMDDLSVSLNSSTSNIRGQIGNIFLSDLCYADDLCLISLVSAGMQKFLGICSKYAIDHSLTYNEKINFSLCFIPGTLKFVRPEL